MTTSKAVHFLTQLYVIGMRQTKHFGKTKPYTEKDDLNSCQPNLSAKRICWNLPKICYLSYRSVQPAQEVLLVSSIWLFVLITGSKTKPNTVQVGFCLSRHYTVWGAWYSKSVIVTLIAKYQNPHKYYWDKLILYQK